ncbi:hypothetical protein AWC38_SpisGene11679 [Stylophora pistillata]|uniref:HECT domain-containing protein n=1 Tax=Stylophora pistillata TaxID=50429 RepID=A0A2B4S3Y2_STYPI|nr:hypothetical protein AWC38_SpisGene11679 [Stylophora pistillata]
MHDDIPGASLLELKPEELNNTELRLWLKCRDDLGKGLKTKAELVKRVYEYIRTSKDKNIVDPDLDKIYCGRKERMSTFTDVSEEEAGAGVKDLLAFWTGCEVLPPPGQNLHVLVDSGKLPSSLPESKSCFHRLTSSPQQTEYAVFKEID